MAAKDGEAGTAGQYRSSVPANATRRRNQFPNEHDWLQGLALRTAAGVPGRAALPKPAPLS